MAEGSSGGRVGAPVDRVGVLAAVRRSGRGEMGSAVCNCRVQRTVANGSPARLVSCCGEPCAD
eukprot:12638327-Heterocapsa_arctica.AAC.1